MQLKTLLLFIALFMTSLVSSAQETIHQTFKDTRVINTQSVETLRKGILDFRIGHRFGDVAGDAGGWPTFFGLENAADVSIGFNYGLSDKFLIGIHRSKGSGPLRQNLHFLTKYRVMHQDVNGKNPFSTTFSLLTSYSTMRTSNLIQKNVHRLSYHFQVLFASRLSERVSVQIGGAWTYRNNVFAGDENNLPSVSGVLKYQFNKSFGLIFDMNYTFSSLRTKDNGYYFPLGVGFEWETGGGHVFQINLTNATGLMETDYIPYTTSDWGQGAYRLGFTISRGFKL